MTKVMKTSASCSYVEGEGCQLNMEKPDEDEKQASQNAFPIAYTVGAGGYLDWDDVAIDSATFVGRAVAVGEGTLQVSGSVSGGKSDFSLAINWGIGSSRNVMETANMEGRLYCYCKTSERK